MYRYIPVSAMLFSRVVELDPIFFLFFRDDLPDPLVRITGENKGKQLSNS
jgi:hypothetical protein